MTFFNPSSFSRAGAISFLYCSCSLFISAHLRLSYPWRLSSCFQRVLPCSQSLFRLVFWQQVLILLSFPLASFAAGFLGAAAFALEDLADILGLLAAARL